jgi:hypothetical protein
MHAQREEIFVSTISEESDSQEVLPFLPLEDVEPPEPRSHSLRNWQLKATERKARREFLTKCMLCVDVGNVLSRVYPFLTICENFEFRNTDESFAAAMAAAGFPELTIEEAGMAGKLIEAVKALRSALWTAELILGDIIHIPCTMSPSIHDDKPQ